MDRTNTIYKGTSVHSALLCLVVNAAAGKGEIEISLSEIEQEMTQGMKRVNRLLGAFLLHS